MMDGKNGHPLDTIWNEMKKLRGCVSEASRIANVTPNWIRVIIRDRLYENEEIVKACIEAIKVKKQDLQNKGQAKADYASRVNELITKELQDEQGVQAERSQQNVKVERRTAIVT